MRSFCCPKCNGLGFVVSGVQAALPQHDIQMIQYDGCRRCEATGTYVPASAAGLATGEPS